MVENLLLHLKSNFCVIFWMKIEAGSGKGSDLGKYVGMKIRCEDSVIKLRLKKWGYLCVPLHSEYGIT